MNDSSPENDPFLNAKYVAVLGGIIDCSGSLREEIRICEIVQAGESDVMVSDAGLSYSSKTVIVPKALCIPLPADYETIVQAKVAKPELGDLVFFCGKLNWKEKENITIAGILCEIKYRVGTPVLGGILLDGEIKEVDYTSLLVLQKKA
jgi:hypothetical protein